MLLFTEGRKPKSENTSKSNGLSEIEKPTASKVFSLHVCRAKMK
jgi:hypothetical protein